MTAPLCVCCGRPTPDGYACVTCGITKPGEQLRSIADMTPAARDIAHGLSRAEGGGASGKPGSRLPLNLRDTEALNQTERVLTKWIDHIGPIRGHPRPWFTHTGDPIAIAATWLTGHLEWMRHQPDQEPDNDGNTWGAQDFLADVAAAARVVAGIARGPAAQRYLGPCGAEIPVGTLAEPDRVHECEGDIYARDGATTGRCRTCGAEVATDLRRAWLDGEVRSHAFRAAHIAEAYGVRANTIRVWADRGRLVAHGHDGEGRPLFNVGDVLDLAAADAARRETERAKRDRRAAARESAEMGA